MKNAKKVDWSDHKFAAWLRKQDPNWDWYSIGSTNIYTAHDQKVAVAIHDNAKCTRKIYILKEE